MEYLGAWNLQKGLQALACSSVSHSLLLRTMLAFQEFHHGAAAEACCCHY